MPILDKPDMFLQENLPNLGTISEKLFINRFMRYLMNEAYVLLNVDYKNQREIIEGSKKISVVKAVKTVYGICDILVILESDDMQKIKDAIDNDLHNMNGIKNLTSLISVN